jgi:thioredoxin-dependent peroxiredoxin
MSEGLLAVGAPAPNFQVKTDNDITVTLSDFAGKTVVLWFYPKADTPGCTREGCGFRDRQEAFTAKNVQILGVSFDTVAENRAFAEKFNFPFPLLCDTNREIGLAYGACDSAEARSAKRISYVIAPDGRIQQVYAKVDTATHPEDILATL